MMFEIVSRWLERGHENLLQVKTRNNALNNMMGYDSKGILVFNLKYEHAISFINLVKFINYYQMPQSISSKLFVIASGGGEANVYGSSYYWNFRTSSFKQVACLILFEAFLDLLRRQFIKGGALLTVGKRFLVISHTPHIDS